MLSIPVKVYGKVIIERVQRLTEEKISEEQEGFRKGRGSDIFLQDGSREDISKRKKNYTLPSWI